MLIRDNRYVLKSIYAPCGGITRHSCGTFPLVLACMIFSLFWPYYHSYDNFCYLYVANDRLQQILALKDIFLQ